MSRSGAVARSSPGREEQKAGEEAESSTTALRAHLDEALRISEANADQKATVERERNAEELQALRKRSHEIGCSE